MLVPLKKWHITNPYLDKKAWNVILHHRAAAAQLRHFTIQTPDNHPQIILQCNTILTFTFHYIQKFRYTSSSLLGPKTNNSCNMNKPPSCFCVAHSRYNHMKSRRWHQRKEKHLHSTVYNHLHPDCPSCEAHWALGRLCDHAPPVPVLTAGTVSDFAKFLPH